MIIELVNNNLEFVQPSDDLPTSQPPSTLPFHATSRGFHHHIILSCTILQLSMYAMTLGTYKHPGVETFAGALIEGLQHHP